MELIELAVIEPAVLAPDGDGIKDHDDADDDEDHDADDDDGI